MQTRIVWPGGLIAIIVAIACAVGSISVYAQMNTGGGFVGDWCAQGDKNRKCSITSQGMQLTLTNESGSTSPGMTMGMNQNTVTAMMWSGVTGTLSSDGKRINWSNGTFWARCGGGHGGGGNNGTPGMAGTWYADGDRSRVCSINQNGRSLNLRNEQGSTATGSVRGQRVTTKGWPGNPEGRLVQNGNRIDWNNGTSWTRSPN